MIEKEQLNYFHLDQNSELISKKNDSSGKVKKTLVINRYYWRIMVFKQKIYKKV